MTAPLVFSLFSAAKAQSQKQQNVDAAISGAERICLSGSRYKFDLKANGDLTILRLAPGAEAELKIDRNQTRGGTFFNDEKVRQTVDQDIRACMERQWPQVSKALAEESGEVSPNSTARPLKNSDISSFYGNYTGKGENTVFHNHGDVSIDIQPGKDPGAVRLTNVHTHGMYGRGTSNGTISPSGELKSSGDFENGANKFDLNISGYIRGNTLVGTYNIYPKAGTKTPIQGGHFELQKFVAISSPNG